MGLNQRSWRNFALLKAGANSKHRVQLLLFSLITRKDGSDYVMASEVNPPPRHSLTSFNKNSSIVIKANI